MRKRPAKRRREPETRRWAPSGYDRLHETFLDRAARKGLDAEQVALGAFLTLRLLDRFVPGQEAATQEAFDYMVQATKQYLVDLDPGDEGEQLLALVRAAREAGHGGPPRPIWKPLLDYARWLDTRRRWRDAADVLSLAIACRPQDDRDAVRACLWLCEVLVRSRRADEADAVRFGAQAIAEASGARELVALCAIERARMLLVNGRARDAEAALLDIINRVGPEEGPEVYAAAHHRLGDVFVAGGALDRAWIEYSKARVTYVPDAAPLDLLLSFARVARRMGKLEDAGAALTELLEREQPRTPRAIAALSELLPVLARLGDRLRFERTRRTVEDLVPAERPRAKLRLAIRVAAGLVRLGDCEAAERALVNALRGAARRRAGAAERRARAALDKVRKRRARAGRIR